MYIKRIYMFYFLILVFIIAFLGGCSNTFSSNQPIAEKGVLDLTDWQFDEEVARLDGQWEFHWNQLLDPDQLNEEDQQTDRLIDVPSSWNQYIINNQELAGDGYATYKLLVKTGESGRLAIKVPRIFTAYNMYVNEDLVASAGITGETRETMTPQYLPQVALFDAKQGENEIVIQVSNFYHRSGGILEALKLGSETLILERQYKSLAFELILFGSLIIIGTYHLALFFFRKKDYSPLYFGLFCILVGIRTLLVGERFLIYVFPDFNWEVAHKIQTLIFYLGMPLILMFFKSIFASFSPKIVRIVQIVGLVFAGIVLLTPARFFTIFNPAYQLFAFFVITYIIIVFLKMLIRREKGVVLIFIGGMALIMSSLNDIIFLSVWMNDDSSSFLRTIFRTGNLTSVGQLIFVFTNSLVLAKNFTNALEKKEEMTRELREINLNLDKLVIERTKDLERSRKEIENQKLELEKANHKLQLISLIDPLTGLWNRRKYDENMLIEWRKSLRHKRPIALLLIDIDHFKAYNDRYGHNAGDECLVKIAQTIKKSFKRADDLAVRYGGEEFVVIMPESGNDEAIKMAEMVRNSIEELKIPHDRSSVSSWVTVSIGVTSRIPEKSEAPKDLFLTVDKALYEAKASGRNRVKFL